MFDRFAVIFVAVAAMLWGTDALFRAPILQHLAKDTLLRSVQLVFMEHLILAACVAPILWLARREIRSLTAKQWRAILIIGVGASGLATILFTISFSYGHFIETLVLQKTQPLIAIVLANLWLRERVPSRAWLWIPIALVGAYFIAIPNPLDPRAAWEDFHIATAVFALAAAAIWGAGTVLGRYALANVRFATLTGLRFATALPALTLLLFALGGAPAFGSYQWADTPLYLGIALIPGLFPMLLYYRGLASTPASLATIAELAFPITGVIVNLLFVTPSQSLTGWQAVGIAVLVGAIVALDLTNAKHPARLERGAEALAV
jgi:drug/metabolite transporter (DMT)-like permease